MMDNSAAVNVIIDFVCSDTVILALAMPFRTMFEMSDACARAVFVFFFFFLLLVLSRICLRSQFSVNLRKGNLPISVMRFITSQAYSIHTNTRFTGLVLTSVSDLQIECQIELEPRRRQLQVKHNLAGDRRL